MIVKNNLHQNKFGHLDPLVREQMLNKSLIPDNIFKKNYQIKDFDILKLRRSMGGENKDISKSKIKEKDFAVPSGNHHVLIRTYKKNNKSILNSKCLLYLHGGGFIGGSIQTMENQCRAIADYSNSLVVSLDYRLSPETVFPGALDDVLNTVDWLNNNAKNIGFNQGDLIICGDSVGGNLAIVVASLDTSKKIKKVITLYAALDFTDIDKTIYHWNYSNYPMCKDDESLIHTRLNKFAYLNKLIRLVYIDDKHSVLNPQISPVYLKNFSNLPPVILIEAEFDYYLQSNKYFANLLRKNNKKVKELEYKGLDHGFFDRLGYLPQAITAVKDISFLINESE